MSKSKRITKWGNSAGIRLPKDILNQSGLNLEDDVKMEVVQLDDGNNAILISSIDSHGSVSALSPSQMQSIMSVINQKETLVK